MLSLARQTAFDGSAASMSVMTGGAWSKRQLTGPRRYCVWLVIEAGAAAVAPQPVAAATATSSGSITRR